MRDWKPHVLVFGTSAAVLTLEILAGRLMAPYVGVSIETFTGIIGVILAGIAAGAAFGGQLADQRDPRPLIAPALIVGGILSWAALPILRLLGPNVGSGPAAIVVLAAATFVLPTTVLSMISPMVAKVRLSSLHETGSVVGGLSASGTVGALVGTFATGFILVAALPSRWVVLGIGTVLVVTGIAVGVRLGRAKVGASMGVVAVLAGTGVVAMPPPCDTETAYFCVRIERDALRPSGRNLYLDRLRHAYVDLEDPTFLDIRYVRLFAAVSESLDDGPLDVLHLGGGGFTFPRYLAAVRPGSEQLVLEIDEDLTQIARDDLGLVTGPRLRVRGGDGRLALAEQPDDAYDLVVGDAFASTSVPWHLTTREVMREIERMLRPGGVYLMNVIDGRANRYARAQLATLMDTFDHVVAILPEGGVPAGEAANQVLVASDRPLPQIVPPVGDGEVVSGRALRRYVGDAQVLRDDHAPVDQLIMR